MKLLSVLLILCLAGLFTLLPGCTTTTPPVTTTTTAASGPDLTNQNSGEAAIYVAPAVSRTVLHAPAVPVRIRLIAGGFPAPARQATMFSAPAGGNSDIAARFEHQLESLRSRELGAGLTLAGPHRDDVRFLIERLPQTTGEKMDAITYASRGQGRTIALSLKLAEVALMRMETGEEPVLLLDDVMSELDAPRRAALSQTVINSPQAIITATDLEDFTGELLARARVLRACEGQIVTE